jgi:membrane protease YdiL (CAAX protease family)
VPEHLRGFGVAGILAIVVIMLTGTIYVGNMVAVPVGAALVLLWAKLSQTPWHEIGFVRPRSWILSVAAGVALGVALKFLMKAIVMPLLGAPPVNHAFQFLAGNRALLPTAIWMMLVAGFAEETIWRGFLFERLGKLCGPGAPAKVAIAAITSALFGLAHYSGQGLPGVQQAVIVGLLYAAIYAAAGRLFMLMVAHAAFDLTALAIIYWRLETTIAHLVFK